MLRLKNESQTTVMTVVKMKLLCEKKTFEMTNHFHLSFNNLRTKTKKTKGRKN